MSCKTVAEHYIAGTINGYPLIEVPYLPGDQVLAVGGKFCASTDAIARLQGAFASVGCKADEATKALLAMRDALQSVPEPYDARRPLYDGLSTKSIQDETPAAPVRRAMRLGKR